MKPNLKNKALFLFIVLIAFVDGMLVLDHFQSSSPVTAATEARTLTDVLQPKIPPEGSEPALPVAKSVPFTTQAPIGHWTERPWSDYAEEACVYMAYKWGVGADLPATAETAANLRAVGQWEIDNYGASELTDIPQTLRMLTEALGYTKASLSTDTSAANMKALLDQGAILIVPVDGQILANRYYGDPAPQYHMIVIYDYTSTSFIANDPGTSRGAATVYTQTKILESLQDLNGEKRMIVVTR